MSIIVGLGNIGAEYEGTRHNIGFDIVNELAKTLSAQFESGTGPFDVAEGRYKGRKIVLIKPTTYMNRSGRAVRKALAKFKADRKNCLVCYDDLNLPLGTIRLKERGSAGGHNGITDIINELGTDDFPRLRFGIGNDFPRGKQVDYVLAPFSEREITEVEIATKESHDAALSFVKEGITRTMNWFN